MLVIAEIHPLTAAELPGSVQTCTKRPGNGPRARQLLDLTRNLSVPRPGRATLAAEWRVDWRRAGGMDDEGGFIYFVTMPNNTGSNNTNAVELLPQPQLLDSNPFELRPRSRQGGGGGHGDVQAITYYDWLNVEDSYAEHYGTEKMNLISQQDSTSVPVHDNALKRGERVLPQYEPRYINLTCAGTVAEVGWTSIAWSLPCPPLKCPVSVQASKWV